jgi:hypothetical protein
VIIEKVGKDRYIVYEINSIGGLDASSNSVVNKRDLYRNRCTPSVTVHLNESSDLAKLVARLAELQLTDWEKPDFNKKIYKQVLFKDFSPVAHDLKKGRNGRPRFTEHRQVSGNYTVKSTELLMRTVFEMSLNKELKGKPKTDGAIFSDLDIKLTAHNTYRMYSIFNRANYLNDFIERHHAAKDWNADKVL